MPAAVLAATVAAISQPAVHVLAQTAYTHAERLVDVGGGRRMNLYCVGVGRTTVVFSAGLQDWSAVWARVQPAIGRETRACSYDRAGLGFSDPATRPSTPFAAADDLHALLRAAGIAPPVVLVGHSMGGFYAKLYAALYPTDVAGVVLVDPGEERDFARTRALLEARYGRAETARYQLSFQTDIAAFVASSAGCAAAARPHDLDPASPSDRPCFEDLGPRLGSAIGNAARRVQMHEAYQSAQASEVATSPYADHTVDEAYARLFAGHPFGAKPLIVLSRSIFDARQEDDAMEHAADVALHEQTAALSTRGTHRIVPHTHHYIEFDRPQAVIAAIDEVLHETGSTRR